MDSEIPAIAGGEKAKTTPYGRTRRYGDEELAQLKDALEQQTLFYAQGRKVYEMEARFAERIGVAHAVACTSGTAAIHAALIALGVSPGDEVITSPITDMGSVVPILYQGAVPIFADLDPATYTVTPEAVEAAITPDTRAVLAVHLAGNACDITGLLAVCRSHGIPLVEDCAQAHGCEYDGRPVGSFGAIGCFSLNEFKHISCGDGGIVVCDDEEMAVRLRLATDKCYDRRPGVTMRNPAFLAANYRMTELQGAVALAQLDKLDSIVERRRSWCGTLTERLQGIRGLRLPTVRQGVNPSWWFYMMRAVPEDLRVTVDELAGALQAEGLPIGAHYIGVPVYRYPIFENHSAFERGGHAYDRRVYLDGACPEAEAILATCLILSVNEAYTQQDLDETILGVQRVMKWAIRS